MSNEPEHRPWIELQRRIDEGDEARLRDYLDGMPASEVALGVSRLDEHSLARLLAVVAPDDAAIVVEAVPDVRAVDAIERLEPGVAAAILSELPDSERADLLGDVDRSAAEAILGAMERDDARATRTLTGYADDVAGGLMTLDYLAYREDATVGDVVTDLREHADEYRDFIVQYVFVTTADNRLVGVLRLRDLLFGRRDRPIRELMIPDPQSVRDDDSLDALRVFFDRNPFYGAPVVDGRHRLVGIVRRSAVNEALADRADDAFLKTQGIVGGEELRSMPMLRRSRRRLAWLSVNIGLNVIAASVIAFYQETLAAVIALAVFLPIISDMSGCSGNQAVAVSMRELALGLVRPAEVVHVWLKELTVGVLNGAVLGGLIAGVAWLWQANPFLGLVVGAAMMLNTVVAVSLGGTLPLMLRRAGVDPALASGPILTTVTDMCGFFLLLSLASALLPRLVAG